MNSIWILFHIENEFEKARALDLGLSYLRIETRTSAKKLLRNYRIIYGY